MISKKQKFKNNFTENQNLDGEKLGVIWLNVKIKLKKFCK